MKHYYTLLCPTRNRPVGAFRYLQSIERTIANPERIEVLFYIDEDDPRLPEYKYLFDSHKTHLNHVDYVVGPRKSVSISWNDIAEKAIGDVLAMGNDDLIHVTPHWDMKLDDEINKYEDEIYCLFFKDLNRSDEAVTFPIVSRKWYNTLGYFTPGIYGFQYNDTHIADIGRGVERLRILHDIQVDHRHWTTTGKQDGIVEQESARNTLKTDGEIYNSAKTRASIQGDIMKLRQVMRPNGYRVNPVPASAISVKRYAVYRILYGEDFIQDSINSITDYVDKIFVFWTNIPFGDVTQACYEGNLIRFPAKFDKVVEKIKALRNDKIVLIEDHVKFNDGQFTHLVNDHILPHYPKPDEIMFIEPDYVWRWDQLKDVLVKFHKLGHLCASTRQVETWRTLDYRVPERQGRMAVMLWNLRHLRQVPLTGKHANHPRDKSVPFLGEYVHNLGFSVSEATMYWKHLTTIAFSQIIKDDPPRIDWFEKVWKNWDLRTNNRNLEISAGYEHHLPHAEPYPWIELPEVIRARYPDPVQNL